jgi:A/G-specific adenine glycosylase
LLHAAAKQIVKKYGGRIPGNMDGLLGLPGIGRYTAAAIASIAYNEAAAVVDGNVERVLSRVAGRQLAGEETWQAANALLDAARSGDFNQAMMELGATICLPRQPHCLLCPVATLCQTRGELKATRATLRQHKREIAFGLARRIGAVFLVQREKEASLMPGMWELPEFPAHGTIKPLLKLRHSITVTEYAVRVMELLDPDERRGVWIPVSRLASLPLTGLARKILRRIEVL